jgi:acyl carrier protein
MNPVPLGVAGELLIGGVSLARGYVGRPGATAEKFIPDPFSAEPGARLYRTGDLACFLPGGDIKYLGRMDHQLKIRGFRVEPGEIESALGQHAGVRETAVLAREFGPGDRRLVAYVVPERSGDGLVAELRAHLRARLPEYMVPSFFVTLDAMPLTPNGKIDRRRLPAPDGARADPSVYVAPRTAAEEVVADIWKSLLGPAQVGVEDNFFDLGGHSLLATQVISRVRETFQLEELPLQSLFESPTVAGLVEVLASLWGGREVVEEIAATVKELSRMLPDEVELMLSEHDADGQARESQPA